MLISRQAGLMGYKTIPTLLIHIQKSNFRAVVYLYFLFEIFGIAKQNETSLFGIFYFLEKCLVFLNIF